MDTEKKIFNIRLQPARKTIERVFGIICKSWQILDGKLNFKLKSSEVIVMSFIYLYNFTFDDRQIVNKNSNSTDNISNKSNRSDTNKSCKSDDPDCPDSQESNVEENNIEEEAASMRNKSTNYFLSTVGSVEWQWRKL